MIMATRPFKCQQCHRSVRTEEGLDHHRQALHYYPSPCPTCNEVFAQTSLLKLHQKSTGHSFCIECDRSFRHDEGLAGHRSALHSRAPPSPPPTQFRCCDCELDFPNEHALNQHLRDKRHVSPHRLGTVCEKCDKEFNSESGLRQHMASVKHAPLCNVKCVGHEKCKKRFNCPSGLLHHLESGACRSGMNRQKLNELIRQNDTDHLITRSGIQDETDLLAIGSFTAPSSEASIIYTPDASTEDGLSSAGSSAYDSGDLIPSSGFSQYVAGQLVIPTAMKCPLCPNRKAFRTFKSLEDHLGSAKHAPKMFQCPSAFAPAPSDATNTLKHFSTLSGLTQHLESGECNGGKDTFEKAIRYVEMNLKQMGIKDLRLSN